MNVASYLPSSRFSTIVVSIALSGALILLAQYITAPKSSPAAVLSADQPTPAEDWQAALEAAQAGAPELPAAPSEDTIQALLKEAQSSNVTSSVARSLFINLSNANAQGLGNDIPTQEKLIADAAARVGSIESIQYKATDLNAVSQNAATMRTWGNAVMQTFRKHPKASNDDVLYAIGYATDYNDAATLKSLVGIGAEYTALAEDLANIPVPTTLVPLYLPLINNLSTMSVATGEMRMVLEDPMRGLSGLQSFQTAGTESARVLTTLAEQLRKGGILFSKDEPGTSWDVFVSSYPQ